MPYFVFFFGLRLSTLWTGIFFAVVLVTGIALSPLGTLLGLMLQLEREFLFSIIYLPLATPIVLAAYSLSADPEAEIWWRILAAFAVGGSYVCALIFEFFFDELSQTL